MNPIIKAATATMMALRQRRHRRGRLQRRLVTLSWAATAAIQPASWQSARAGHRVPGGRGAGA